MDAIKFLFWLSAFSIFYAYWGYPIVLWIISFFKYKSHKKYIEPYLPKVSLLISVYNEEAVIEDKIHNSLMLNYPKDLIEILVISDDSNDRTNEIIKKYEDKGLVLRNYEGRIGKTACLNKAVPLSGGNIIIFSDANSMYEKDAVKNMVINFANDKVGFVTGYTKYCSKDGEKISASIGLYSRIEKFTKKLESKIGSCVGADGAIFAIRKHLYKPLLDVDINDFVIPLNIIRQGFKGILEENAYCIEKTAGDPKGEFRRQIRITNRTLRAILNNIDLLNPFKFSLFSFELLSHKISKFLAPFFILTLFFTSIILINNGLVYSLALLAQAMFFLLAWLGHNGLGFKGISKLSALCHTFAAINLAILGGWLKLFRGETYTTWSPVKR